MRIGELSLYSALLLHSATRFSPLLPQLLHLLLPLLKTALAALWQHGRRNA